MRIPKWFRTRKYARAKKSFVAFCRRRLLIEMLEDRRVLASLYETEATGTYSVTNSGTFTDLFVDENGNRFPNGIYDYGGENANGSGSYGNSFSYILPAIGQSESGLYGEFSGISGSAYIAFPNAYDVAYARDASAQADYEGTRTFRIDPSPNTLEKVGDPVFVTVDASAERATASFNVGNGLPTLLDGTTRKIILCNIGDTISLTVSGTLSASAGLSTTLELRSRAFVGVSLSSPSVSVNVVATDFDELERTEGFSLDRFGPYLNGVILDVPFVVTVAGDTELVDHVNWQIGAASGQATRIGNTNQYSFHRDMANYVPGEHALKVTAFSSSGSGLGAYQATVVHVDKDSLNLELQVDPGENDPLIDVESARFFHGVSAKLSYEGSIAGLPHYYMDNATLFAGPAPIGSLKFTNSGSASVTKHFKLTANSGSFPVGQTSARFGIGSISVGDSEAIQVEPAPTWLTLKYNVATGDYEANNYQLKALEHSVGFSQTNNDWIDEKLKDLESSVQLYGNISVSAGLKKIGTPKVKVNSLYWNFNLLGEPVAKKEYAPEADLEIDASLDNTTLNPTRLSISLKSGLPDIADKVFLFKEFKYDLLNMPFIPAALAKAEVSLKFLVKGSLSVTGAGLLITTDSFGNVVYDQTGTFIGINATPSAQVNGSLDVKLLVLGAIAIFTGTVALPVTVDIHFNGALTNPKVHSAVFTVGMKLSYNFRFDGYLKAGPYSANLIHYNSSEENGNPIPDRKIEVVLVRGTVLPRSASLTTSLLNQKLIPESSLNNGSAASVFGAALGGSLTSGGRIVSLVPDDHGATMGMATLISIGAGTAGALEVPQDQDMFRFPAVEGVTYEFELELGTLEDGLILLEVNNNGTTSVLAEAEVFLPDTIKKIVYTPTQSRDVFLLVGSALLSTLGTYTVRVRTRSTDDHGNSYINATAIGIDSTTPGVIGVSQDEDVFRVNVVAGAAYLFQVTSGTLSGSTLTLLGGDGVTIIDSSSNSTNGAFESRLVYRASTTGSVYLRVNGALIDSIDTLIGSYDLIVSPFQFAQGDDPEQAVPLAVGALVPATLAVENEIDLYQFPVIAGINYDIEIDLGTLTEGLVTLLQLQGGELSPIQSLFLEPLSARGTLQYFATSSTNLYVQVRSARGTSFGTYSLRPKFHDDNGNAASNATTLAIDTMVQGRIEETGDVDIFRLPALAEQPYLIELEPGASTERILGIYQLEADVLTLVEQVSVKSPDGFLRLNYATTSARNLYVRVSSPTVGSLTPYKLKVSVVDDHGDLRTDATSVALGSTTNGWMEQEGDVDVFKWPVVAGDNYRIETILYTLTDSTLALFDANGNVAVFNDDATSTTTSSQIDFQADSSGFAYVRVGSPGGELMGKYSVKVSKNDDHGNSSSTASPVVVGTIVAGNLESSNDIDLFRFSVVSGKHYVLQTELETLPDSILTLLGSDGVNVLQTDDDGGQGLSSRISFTATTTGNLFVKVASYLSSGNGTYRLSISEVPPPVDDFGNTAGAAVLLSNSSTTGGILEQATDKDMFKVAVTAGMVYTFKSTVGSLYDSTLTLLGEDGTTVVDFNDDAPDGATLGSELVYTPTANGTRFLTVGSYNGQSMGSYSLIISSTPSTNIVSSLSNTNIQENQPTGTVVGTFSSTGTVGANTFTYVLATGTGSTDNSSFSIAGNQISINSIPNFEVKSTYSIRVRSTNQSGLSAEQVFTINVVNVNESPTNILLSNSTIAENGVINAVVGNLTATDPDAGSASTFSLPSGISNNSLFNLNGNVLRANSSFNFEAQSTYIVTVRVTDAGGLAFDKPFTIGVTNVNENPTDVALSTTSVPENAGANAIVGTLSATDPDAGSLFTFILPTGVSNNNLFNVSGNSLRANASFNFEATSSYIVTLQVSDGALTFNKQFIIGITNVNEAPTNITISNSTIAENAGVNAVVGTLSGFDPDASAVLTFSLPAGLNSNSLFNLSGNLLRANGSVDYEAFPSHIVTVQASDGVLIYNKQITIGVQNVNDPPLISAPSTQSVQVNSPQLFSTAGANAIIVTDVDAGLSQVQLALSTSAGLMTLSSTNGLTFTNGANGQASFTIQGTLTNINAALNGVSYQPNLNFTGSASIQLTLNDLGNSGIGGIQLTTRSIALTVSNPIFVVDNNDPSYIESGVWVNSSVTGYNSTSTRFANAGNATATWNAPALTPGYYSVALWKVSAAGNSTNAQISVIHNGITEPVQSINLATGPSGFVTLGTFFFSGAPGEFVRLAQGVTVANLRADAVSFTRTATANAAPTIAAPTTQAVDGNIPRVFSITNANAITVGDVDAGTAQVELALTTTNGLLTLASTAGLIFTNGANGQASFTIRGTLSSLNTALSGLIYQPNSNFVGSAAIQLNFNDLGNSGTGGAKSASRTIALTVSNPVFIVDNGGSEYSETGAWANSAITGYNGTNTRFANSSTATASWNAPSLSPGYYSVALWKVAVPSNSSDARITITHNGITEPAQAINLSTVGAGFVTLGTFFFTGAPGEFVRLSQGPTGGNLRADSVRFTRIPVANATPTILVPLTQTVAGNTARVFSTVNANAITLADADAGLAQMQLTLSATNGLLTLPNAAGFTYTSGANGQASFTVRGTLSSLNSALNGLSYQPNLNFTGSASIQLTLNDLGNAGIGGAKSASASMTLIVSSPVFVVDNGTAGYIEAGTWVSSAITGFNGTNTRFANTATATATWNAPSLAPGYYEVAIWKVSVPSNSSSARVSIVHNGITEPIQAFNLSTAGAGFVTLGTFFFTGAPGEFVRLSQGPTVGNLRADAVRFTRMPVTNATPTILAPLTQTVAGNTARVFSTANANAITVADVDAGLAPVQLFLSATNGLLTLPSTAGLTFTSGANGQASFTVRGTLSNLNTALNGLRYQPNLNFAGSASIQLTLNDLGNTGTGGANSASRAIALTVNSPIFVVDNGAPGYVETGSWVNSTVTGFNGTNTRFATAANAVATWNAPTLAPGFYSVVIWRVVSATNSNNARVTIVHNGITESPLTVDLSSGVAGFLELGTFFFSGAPGEQIRLSQGTTVGNLRADSVRFTKLP